MPPQAAPRPRLQLASGASGPALTLGRVHEVCGPARAVFAALAAAQLTGPALWITPLRERGALNPDGLSAFLDPARLVIARVPRREDALWCLEEALRSGALRFAAAEIAEEIALTPMRRLQLAAGASGTHPLGLLLTPAPRAAGAVESRWRAAPRAAWAGAPPEAGVPAPRWRFESLYDKSAPLAVWESAPPARPGVAPLFHRHAA